MTHDGSSEPEISERRFDRRATVTIGVMSIIGGLLGVFLGGVISYIGTKDQIENQNTLVDLQIADAQATYLRNERRRAYAELASDSTKFVGVMNATVQALRFRVASGELQRLLKRQDVVAQDFLVSYADVRIIGSSRASRLAEELRVSLLESQGFIVTELTNGPSGFVVRRGIEQLTKSIDAQEAFISSVRDEVGN